jgi:hypothetical protein
LWGLLISRDRELVAAFEIARVRYGLGVRVYIKTIFRCLTLSER